MTDLVTGGSGFIGQHLVRRLAESGQAVRVLDSAPLHRSTSAVEVVEGSVTDRAAVRRAIAGVGCVYHLAANTSLWTRHKPDYHAVNYVGTRILLEEARRAGVARVVHTSTQGVLIGKRSGRGAMTLDESVQTRAEDMLGPYCRAKHLAESAARAAARDGLAVVVVNPTIPMGPGDRKRTPPTEMLLRFLQGKNPAYFDCTLNVVDARDVAIGHMLAARYGRPGERYILGGTNLVMGELLARLGELSGRSMPRRRVPYWVALCAAGIGECLADHVTRRPPVAPLTGVRLTRWPLRFDSGKAERELGFAPRPLRETLRDTVSWLAGEGAFIPSFELAAAEESGA